MLKQIMKTLALMPVAVRSLALSLVMASSGNAIASNALEPCPRDVVDEYHNAVNRQIDKAVARPSSLELTVFPSFQPESGVRLAGAELYLVEFQSSYWYASYQRKSDGWHLDFKNAKVTTKVNHAPLHAELAQRIEQAYLKAIANAKKSERAGLDGVSYVFSSSSAGVCGRTWSPHPGSRNGRLVALMEHLQQHTRFSLPIDLQRSEKAIGRAVDALEMD
jgi:hypothetical protein